MSLCRPLQNGWVYEGWVVDTSGEMPAPTTTGRFSAVDEADSDGGGPAGGSMDTPPFPGQDFIDPSTVLTGGNWAAVITLEPDLDDDPAGPYSIKPLSDDTIEDVGAGASQDMTNTAADTLPSDTATWTGS